MEPDRIRPIVAELLDGRANFHGWAEDVEVDWGINAPALRLLLDVVKPEHRALETGVGYSTVVLGGIAREHTVVSPFSFEHERVRAWCGARGVDLDGTTFVAAASQDALPGLDPTPLDVVLIDGDHAFPTPFIDFWYAGRRLVEGGLLIVDDTHLRTGEVLADFLDHEDGRWRVRTRLERTVAYERLGGPLVPPEGWAAQPWGAVPSTAGGTSLDRLRSRLRIRTRARALLRR